MDDIKIADLSPKKADGEEESEIDEQLLALIQEQKSNGNIEKAPVSYTHLIMQKRKESSS